MAAEISKLQILAACMWASLAGLSLAPHRTIAQTIPAFSGADGAAANVSGGRGGLVYHVTKLNSAIDDSLRNDLGTIRYGLNNANFPAGVPRTIVFDVGGVFNLGRLPQVGWDPNGNGWDAQSRLTIGGTNVTLAGQTAPGAGVIFMGGGLKPQGNNNIIRNITVAAGYGLQGWWSPGAAMRAAPGTPEAGTDASQWFPDNTVFDAMDIAGTNLMIDHVSTLYATDETISMNEVANNVTVQYSNISQGQNYPQWDAEGGGLTGHALGSLLEAGSSSAQAAISFHHNLYAHQKARVPQTQSQSGSLGAFYDFRNNVFYNWFGTAGSKSGATSLNLVNNFYLAGDGGDNPIGGSNPGLAASGGGTGVLSASSSVYRNGNLLDANKDADANDGVALAAGGAANPLWKNGAATYAGVTDAATQAFDRVLNYVGANWSTRNGVIDTPDERIINEARTGTGKIAAWADDPWNNDPAEGAEWRALKNTPQANRAATWDTEASVGYGVGDGMPTWWEVAHGLDPNVRDDVGDFDSDGYTNLEEYINEIAEWPAPQPIVFNGATNNRYAQITNWDIKWQPSRFDEAQIRNGAVAIDAVGQHAGVLKLAPTAGDSATLSVTGGWIEVADAMAVGAAGAGVVNHSGGAVAADTVALGGAGAASGIYNLSGSGLLRVGTLTKGATGGAFNFTGGTLSADVVTFDLVNQGGVLSPGSSPGTMHVVGNLTLNAGSVLIELGGASAGQFDEIVVDGALTAGGALSVILLPGFTPKAGDAFDVFDFTAASGAFSLNLPALGANLAWNASNLLTTGSLSVVASVTPSADFNGDLLVDGQDFLIWQRGLGMTGQTDRAGGDADRDGTTDADDLIVWTQQFGALQPSLAAGGSIPEPASAVLALVAVVLNRVRTSRKAKSSNDRRNVVLGGPHAAHLIKSRVVRRNAMRATNRTMCGVGVIVATCLLTPAATAQLPAFPGAQGFGALAVGGRGGEVFHVDNTGNGNTGTYEGPNGYNRGTLRWCLLTETSTLPRTVVFDVSGQVTLTSQITLETSNMTVAGQTAPDQGLSTAKRPWLVESGGNLVIRYIRNRLGKGNGQDSIGVEGGSNIIFDHVTSTWSNDEALSVAKDGTLVTVQNSMIYEGLNHSGHGYGSLIRPDVDSKVSYHHNLYANNLSRNPRPGTYNSKTLDFDFRNNVIYNWGDRAGYSGGSSEGNLEHVNMNFVGNYAIPGASTTNNPTYAFVTDTFADLKAYQSGNLIDSDLDAVRDGVDTGWAMFRDDAGNPGVLTQMAAPFPLAAVPVTTSSAADAYNDVLDHAGSFWWNRDAADARVVNQVRTQTGAIIVDETVVGGFPVLPSTTRPANWDTDHDGMPNAWETDHGLNPNLSSDRNNDFDSDGYTNLEEYLNEVGAFPAPTAISWKGGTGRFALNANWDVWQPSRFDDVYLNSGVVTVDALGQQAGSIEMAIHPGDNAQLNITSGRLETTEGVFIGSDSAGTAVLRLSGGVLDTPFLGKGIGGSFQFTGGALHAGIVNFPLVNDGGTLAPGHSVGMTEVQGDLTLNGGVLEIEVGGKSFGQFDRVEVDGVARLGGTLRVKLVDLGAGAYAPQLGDSIAFLSSAGTDSEFAAFDLPPLAPGLAWAIAPGNVATFLTIVPAWAGNAADFNHDGVVNAGDLLAWRQGFGKTGQLSNSQGDANGDGSVDGRDLLVWQQQLGAAQPSANVPEPHSLVGPAAAGLTLLLRRRWEPLSKETEIQ